MRLEARTGKDHMTGRIYSRGVVLIAENAGESRLLDEVFGKSVRPNGTICNVTGSLKLSDGCGEHYLWIERMKAPPAFSRDGE